MFSPCLDKTLSTLFLAGWLLTLNSPQSPAQSCCENPYNQVHRDVSPAAHDTGQPADSDGKNSKAEKASPDNGDQDVLRVAGDPNNLPFSNERLEGFENKLAELVARDLNRRLVYHWRAQRRGFFRHTLKDGDSHLVMSVPVKSERTLVTRPYYRSSYVFLSRMDHKLELKSFNDARLTSLKIGVQLVGDDGTNTPPVHALAARGAVNNVVGYTVYGDYSEENPPARIVDAVIAGDVDAAVVWGPVAAYFAKKSAVSLTIQPTPEVDELTQLPMTFELGVGVRRDDPALRDAVDEILRRRVKEIDALLQEFAVPLIPPPLIPAETSEKSKLP